MKSLRIISIVLFIILIAIIVFESYMNVATGDGIKELLAWNFKLITIPLWASLVLFGYCSFKKDNKHLMPLSIAGIFLMILYFIIG